MCGLGTGSFVFFKSGWNSRAWGWQHTVRARRLMGQLPRESVNHQSGRPSEFGNFQIQIFQHNDCNGLVWRVIREDELGCLWLPASRYTCKMMVSVSFQCALDALAIWNSLAWGVWGLATSPSRQVSSARGASKPEDEQATRVLECLKFFRNFRCSRCVSACVQTGSFFVKYFLWHVSSVTPLTKQWD